MGKVLFIACTPVARYMMLEILNNPALSDVEICGVVNLNATQAAGKANFDPYYDLVATYNLPIHYCNNVNDVETLAWMQEKRPDIIIQSGWSQKFGAELLALPKYGCIGEHPAPLPRGRGAACINWAILTGETSWGDSFFEMCDQYDAGKLYAQDFFEIDMNDDVSTVYDKVALTSRSIIRKHIANWVNGKFDSLVQDENQVTYYKRRRPADGEFTFEMNGLPLYNFIRAQAHPYPGAFFMHNGKKTTVWKVRYTGMQTDATPGTFLNTTDTGGILVAAADGMVLEFLRMQTEGEPPMWGADWYHTIK